MLSCCHFVFTVAFDKDYSCGTPILAHTEHCSPHFDEQRVWKDDRAVFCLSHVWRSSVKITISVKMFLISMHSVFPVTV